VRTDEDAVRLFGQALISAKLYPRAAAALEPVAGPNAKEITLYLLGVAHSRANNFPKAIAAFERANAKAGSYDSRGLALVCARTWANACLASMRNDRLRVGASLVGSSLTLGFANMYGAEWVAAALPGLLGIG